MKTGSLACLIRKIKLEVFVLFFALSLSLIYVAVGQTELVSVCLSTGKPVSQPASQQNNIFIKLISLYSLLHYLSTFFSFKEFTILDLCVRSLCAAHNIRHL